MAGYPQTKTCCCDGIPDPPDCEPVPIPFDNCTGIVECLQAMRAFVTLVFEDDDGCQWSALNGTYPAEEWGCYAPGSYNEQQCALWAQKFAAAGCGGIDFCTGFLSGWECADGILSFQMGMGCSDDDTKGPIFSASGSVALPVNIASGFTLTLTPVAPCAGTDDYFCPKLIAASVTVYGPACDELDPCELGGGPTAILALTPGASGGCNYNVTNLSIAGDCDIVQCIYSDGYVGCGPRPPFGVSGCGEHSGELTLWVIDEKGCIAEDTVSWSCCNCDDGEGNACEPVTPSISHSQTLVDSYDPGGTDCGFFRHVSVYDMHFTIEWDASPDTCGIGKVLVVDIPGEGLRYFAGSPTNFTLTNIETGYAPHFCLKAWVISSSVDTDPEDPPIGCPGPVICYNIINGPSYPGNACDWDPETCWFTTYTDCCPDWEGCPEEEEP